MDGVEGGPDDSFEEEGETDVVDERDFGGGGIGFVLGKKTGEEEGRGRR